MVIIAQKANAPTTQFPPQAPSSADAVRSIPERDERADERVDRSDTDTSRVRAARHLLKEDKVVESQGRSICAGLWRTMQPVNHGCKDEVWEKRARNQRASVSLFTVVQ